MTFKLTSLMRKSSSLRRSSCETLSSSKTIAHDIKMPGGCAKGNPGVDGVQLESNSFHSRLCSCQNTTGNDTDIQAEFCRLSEYTTILEGEVKERTELLRNLQERRTRVTLEREKLKRYGSPSAINDFQDSKASWAKEDSSHTKQCSSSCGSGVSEARKACMEAYARMTPTQRYLMKQSQLRRNGVGRGSHEAEAEYLERESQSRRRVSESTPRFTENVGNEELRINGMSNGAGTTSQENQHHSSWELYKTAWSEICSFPPDTSDVSLKFRHLPWPITDVFITVPVAPYCAVDENILDAAFSAKSISSFLLSSYHSDEKSCRKRLHEALLRYHPDKFEHQVLRLVVDEERVAAQQVSRRITDVLNSLLLVDRVSQSS